MTSHELTMQAIDGGILGDPFVVVVLIWIAVMIIALWVDIITSPYKGGRS